MRRLGEILLKILAGFLILEPIWMLLPFAGFLYGSVFQIRTLAREPATAWLTHFVFPVLTLGPLGPILALIGLLLFAIGAVQIYAAKIRKSGIVTTGLYRFVRHPQYISLTLFGLGILLTWGRAVAWVGFFAMMFLYYWLARNEEERCRAAFGEEYERYRERTSFIFPGDRRLPFRPSRRPLALRVAVGMVLTAAACFGSMALVDAVKASLRTVPRLEATVALDPTLPGSGVPHVAAGRLAVVRGPWRDAAAPGFAEGVLDRIRGSAALRDFLSFLDQEGGDSAVVFCLERKFLVLRIALAPGKTLDDAFADPSAKTIRAAAFVPEDLEGEVFRPGPGFPAEERWSAFVAPAPERHPEAHLLMVKAPILRTRLDPAFAEEILDRLVASKTFRDRLARSGAGGDLVPVAFPRPGPNWYREHHGAAEISVFVILVRGEDPFGPGGRELVRAFTAEMDFAIAPPADSVTATGLIGPKRDLEERWAFFLSGL